MMILSAPSLALAQPAGDPVADLALFTLLAYAGISFAVAPGDLPVIAVRSSATVFQHGKASAMRVESPETGLSGFDWCCGGQHRQARPPAFRIPRLFLPSSKVI